MVKEAGAMEEEGSDMALVVEREEEVFEEEEVEGEEVGELEICRELLRTEADLALRNGKGTG